MNKRKVIFNPIHLNAVDYSLADFECDAQKARSAGATHMMISQLEKSRWIWERDRRDPYPNWGMLSAAVFKIIVPAKLKGHLPEDFAQRNLAKLRARSEILKKYGLKGALQFCEPFYLPELVYQEHPTWRGPSCEHPRRARLKYFSPCVDQPEVLELYRQAMRDLLGQIEVDYVFLHTNDSGSGLCWSQGLYNGANGPAWCKHRTPAERIIGFLDTFQQAAKDVQREIEVEINANIGFKEAEQAMDFIWPALKDGMAVNFKNRRGAPQTAWIDAGWEFSIAPLPGIPLVVPFLERLEAVHNSTAEIASFTLAPVDHDEYFRVAAAFNQAPTYGLRDRAALLRKVAADLAGEGRADALVEAWHKTASGLLHFNDSNIEGLTVCSVNQRLINRPLVLFPAELTWEEKSYYRPFQFQANDEAQADDLLNWQCTSFIRGPYAIFLAVKALERAMQANQAAIDALSTGGEDSSFLLLADRLRLLNSFYLNLVHAMKFQDIIDNIDPSIPPEITPRWPQDADPRLLDYEALTRAEIDNTLEIIRLIEGRERQMLVTAPTPDLEDIFLLSPQITDQLHHKIAIMEAHRLDGKRAFRTHNH